MEEGYLLDGPTVSRIANCVKAFEGNQFNKDPKPFPDGYGRTGAVYQTVKVTGAAISTGYYPGKVRVWNNITATMSDGVDCRVREVSGGSLTNGQEYTHCRLIGVDTVSGVDYLVFQAAETGGGSPLEVGWVVPFRFMDVYYGPPFYGGSFNQKQLVYVKNAIMLQPKTTGIPDLSNLAQPGENYWNTHLGVSDLNEDIYTLDNPDSPPIWSTSNTTIDSYFSSVYYEASYPACYYMRDLCARPACFGVFAESPSTWVHGYGGSNVYCRVDSGEVQNQDDHYYPKTIVNSFCAWVKYTTITSARYGVAGPFPWKDSTGTSKNLYYWFPDLFQILNTGTTALQLVRIQPITAGILQTPYPSYGSNILPGFGLTAYVIANKL